MIFFWEVAVVERRLGRRNRYKIRWIYAHAVAATK